MVYGCCNRMIKSIFCVVNLFICLFGGLICVFSLWANLDQDYSQHLAGLAQQMQYHDLNHLSKYHASLWIFAIIGFFLFIVGLFGMLGALCENSVFLRLFFFIIFTLTVCEVGATILAISSQRRFEESLHQLLDKVSYKPEYMKNLQPIQDYFHCCGATFQTQQLYKEQGLCSPELLTKEDCYTVISDQIKSGDVVIVIAFLLLFIEILALTSSCVLLRAFRGVDRYYYS